DPGRLLGLAHHVAVDGSRQEPRPGPGRLNAMTEQLAYTDSWRTRQSQLQLVALGVAVAVAAIVVALLMARNGGGSAIPAVDDGPKLVSQAQLERFAGTLDHPL